ncbi:hypothetical protein Tco_1523367 [Tanacetum coccineum]
MANIQELATKKRKTLESKLGEEKLEEMGNEGHRLLDLLFQIAEHALRRRENQKKHEIDDDDIPMAPFKRKKQDQIKITGRTRLCRLFDEDSSDLEKDLYEEASEEDLDEEDSDLNEEDSDQEEELDEEDIDQEEDLDEEDSDQEDSDDGWD